MDDQGMALMTHTHTHTHTFNGPFSGTTRVSRYQKGKTNLDFTGARDSEWQWHQLGHMQVCTSLQTDASACRVNANRGRWQLFARAPLLTRDKDLSQPASRVDTIRHAGNYFVPLSIRFFIISISISFLFFLLQKLCQIT